MSHDYSITGFHIGKVDIGKYIRQSRKDFISYHVLKNLVSEGVGEFPGIAHEFPDVLNIQVEALSNV